MNFGGKFKFSSFYFVRSDLNWSKTNEFFSPKFVFSNFPQCLGFSAKKIISCASSGSRLVASLSRASERPAGQPAGFLLRPVDSGPAGARPPRPWQPDGRWNCRSRSCCPCTSHRTWKISLKEPFMVTDKMCFHAYISPYFRKHDA